MDFIAEHGVTIAVVFVGLFAVVKMVIDQMAKKTVIDGWDDAKEVIDKLSPIVNQIESWADPEDDAVPPSPNNPGGLG